MSTLPLEALLPFLVITILFTGYCLISVARASETRYLNRGWWMLICLLSMPMGGIFYLLLGRKD